MANVKLKDERKARYKVNKEERAKVKGYYMDGYSTKEIAEKYGVAVSTIRRILREKDVA